jgi:hypothetical protein
MGELSNFKSCSHIVFHVIAANPWITFICETKAQSLTFEFLPPTTRLQGEALGFVFKNKCQSAF